MEAQRFPHSSPGTRQVAYRLTQTDVDILIALNQVHYLTAAQLSRLFYAGTDADRYSQRRLKRLADAGYVLRLRALPTPRFGAAPHVFTLSNRGRRYLEALGVALTSPYQRPSEEAVAAENQPFMRHTLSSVDVLVAALRLCRDDDVTCHRLLTERQLKRGAVRVTGASGKRTAVIPDAFLELSVGGQPPIAISLELDRATEDQKRWRQKVEAIAAWAAGPYQDAFGSDNLTIAVVAPTPSRVSQLRGWTSRELSRAAAGGLSDIFLFTSASPVAVSPAAFFTTPIWEPLGGGRPVSLLDAPAGPPAPHSSAAQVRLSPSVGVARPPS